MCERFLTLPLIGQWTKLRENFLFMSLFVVVLAIILFLLFYILKLPNQFYSIPLALISLAGYSILRAKELRNMMRDTMIDIIQNMNYLRIFKHKQLNTMLNKIHQVYYDLPEEMEPDNLYGFIKTNILDKYIGKAYIEGLVTTWEIHNDASRKCYKIIKTSDYKIMASRNEETKGRIPITIAVSTIDGRPTADHFPLDEWYIQTAIGESEDWEKEDITSKGKMGSREYSYDLEYDVTKETSVRVRSKIVAYERADDRTAHQIFVLPTHGLKLTIIVRDFPDVAFNLKFAGIPPSHPDREESVSDTRYELDFRGWMIPGNSVTITF
jgi:hypothetical protein